ncbi:MAG: tetratricopeptide repeat protein [Devosiaceae bacterium]|nr:tetratricopeptide repeat protein [Devosiaceae bacterium]
MFNKQSGIKRIFRTFLLAGASVIILSSCASNRTTMQSPDYSGMSVTQTQATLSQLSARYKANPRDKTTIIHFAAALRAAGQSGQSVAVLQQAISSYPKDMDIKVSYAKALAADGKFSQALNIIDQTIMPDRPNWNALLVKGAILDQMGQNQAARQLYRQALAVSPNQASLEANLGLSYAMTNELALAEQHLLRAVSMPRASSQIRQNLALIYGLQGKFDKARAIYSQLLPPEQVKSNMAYIRALLTQQNNWDKIPDAN